MPFAVGNAMMRKHAMLGRTAHLHRGGMEEKNIFALLYGVVVGILGKLKTGKDPKCKVAWTECEDPVVCLDYESGWRVTVATGHQKKEEIKNKILAEQKSRVMARESGAQTKKTRVLTFVLALEHLRRQSWNTQARAAATAKVTTKGKTRF